MFHVTISYCKPAQNVKLPWHLSLWHNPGLLSLLWTLKTYSCATNFSCFSLFEFVTLSIFNRKTERAFNETEHTWGGYIQRTEDLMIHIICNFSLQFMDNQLVVYICSSKNWVMSKRSFAFPSFTLCKKWEKERDQPGVRPPTGFFFVRLNSLPESNLWLWMLLKNL